MRTHTFSDLKYALNGYFMRNGMITTPVTAIDGLSRLAERVSGKPCIIDRAAYLREFAENHGIRPCKPTPKRNIRRAKAKPTNTFYLSREWQALRYQVIRHANGMCAACGATAQSSGRPMHVDHIIPRSIDPSKALEFSNLQLLCEACNLGKSNTDSINWKQRGKSAKNQANP